MLPAPPAIPTWSASMSKPPMARSTRPVDGKVPPGTFRHAPSNTTYTITTSGQVGTLTSQGR